MARDDWDDEIILEDVMPSTRPYVVTGGNTRPEGAVAIETLVETVPAEAMGLRFEKERVAQLASSAPLSVAELSAHLKICLLYTSPSPRDKRQSRMPSSA